MALEVGSFEDHFSCFVYLHALADVVVHFPECLAGTGCCILGDVGLYISWIDLSDVDSILLHL